MKRKDFLINSDITNFINNSQITYDMVNNEIRLRFGHVSMYELNRGPKQYVSDHWVEAEFSYSYYENGEFLCSSQNSKLRFSISPQQYNELSERMASGHKLSIVRGEDGLELVTFLPDYMQKAK